MKYIKNYIRKKEDDCSVKAVQVKGYGDVSKLSVVEIPIPEPKENEVLIKVKACAINNTEIWMREGAYGTDSKSGWRPEGVQFPRTPGSDITGNSKSREVSRRVYSGKRCCVIPFYI